MPTAPNTPDAHSYILSHEETAASYSKGTPEGDATGSAGTVKRCRERRPRAIY